MSYTESNKMFEAPADGSHVADLIGHEVTAVKAVGDELVVTFDNGETLAASFYAGEGSVMREGPDGATRWWIE